MRTGVGPHGLYSCSSIADTSTPFIIVVARSHSSYAGPEILLLQSSSIFPSTTGNMAALEKQDAVHSELQPVTTKENQEMYRNELTMDEKGNVTTIIDYSGAHEKTDPREIALVRKLDRWIMPM